MPQSTDPVVTYRTSLASHMAARWQVMRERGFVLLILGVATAGTTLLMLVTVMASRERSLRAWILLLLLVWTGAVVVGALSILASAIGDWLAIRKGVEWRLGTLGVRVRLASEQRDDSWSDPGNIVETRDFFVAAGKRLPGGAQLIAVPKRELDPAAAARLHDATRRAR